MSEGVQILAPSAIKAAGQMWTDSKMMQDFPAPKEMTAEDLLHTKAEYVAAAKNTLDAGFDGLELHAANGYLLEQFLSPVSNIRKDNYDGSIENRSRFVMEVSTNRLYRSCNFINSVCLNSIICESCNLFQ